MAEKALEAVAANAAHSNSGVDLAPVDLVRTMLLDARIGERAFELIAQQHRTLAAALNEVGAEAVRTAGRNKDDYALARARELAEVCEALSVFVDDRWNEIPRGSVLIGDHFTVFDLLVCAWAQPAAVVLSEHGLQPVARPLLDVLGVPSVCEVGGLLRWAISGEVALVDADHGLVRLNPSRVEIASARAEKRNP